MRFLLFFLAPFLMFGQEPTQKEEPLFVALYTIGEAWDTQKSPAQQQYFNEHSTFLQQLRADGTITMGARYADTGMIIFKALDLDNAKKLLNADSAIQNRLFNVAVHAFAPFYKGCID